MWRYFCYTLLTTSHYHHHSAWAKVKCLYWHHYCVWLFRYLSILHFKYLQFILTSLVERVLFSSSDSGEMVSTTMVSNPAKICSSAARPPSAAAAVRACWESTAPTRVSLAELSSYILTPGRISSSDSATASRIRSWSAAVSFWGKQTGGRSRNLGKLIGIIGNRFEGIGGLWKRGFMVERELVNAICVWFVEQNGRGMAGGRLPDCSVWYQLLFEKRNFLRAFYINNFFLFFWKLLRSNFTEWFGWYVEVRVMIALAPTYSDFLSWFTCIKETHKDN